MEIYHFFASCPPEVSYFLSPPVEFISLLPPPGIKYYLIHEKERFIIFEFRYDKMQLFECIKGLQIRRIVMLNRMQHYIKNTNERDRLYKVSS